jgi:hypothetical protein
MISSHLMVHGTLVRARSQMVEEYLIPSPSSSPGGRGKISCRLGADVRFSCTMNIEAYASVGAGLCACTDPAGTDAQRHRFFCADDFFITRRPAGRPECRPFSCAGVSRGVRLLGTTGSCRSWMAPSHRGLAISPWGAA